MTIRFTCAGCGSLLKIKDELAGTDGKCPKCKTEFVVPDPSVEEESDDSAEVLVAAEPKESHSKEKAVPEKPREKDSEKAVEKSASPAKSKKGADDDFDPADFLMGDEKKNKVARSIPLYEEMDREEERSRANAAAESRPKKSTPKPPSSAEMPTTPTGVSASAHAKDMMMKAMEDSRLHAGELPPEEEKPGFDWAGFFQEYGLKWGGAILFGLVVSVSLYFMFDRMMGSRLKLPKLATVTGTVTLDGKALAGATVYFAPLEAAIADAKKERARTSYGITDDKGHYEMVYLGSVHGVAVGKCRVWLDLVGPTGQVIPPDWTEAVMKVQEVKAGRNDIPFDMKSP